MSNQLQMNSQIQEEQDQGMGDDEAVESQPEKPEIRNGKKRKDTSGGKSGIKKSQEIASGNFLGVTLRRGRNS